MTAPILSTAKQVVPPLLRVADVAALLSVRPSTVYEWVRMDYIPHIRLGVGRRKPCVRFDHDEVLSWINERRKRGRATRVPTG